MDFRDLVKAQLGFARCSLRCLAIFGKHILDVRCLGEAHCVFTHSRASATCIFAIFGKRSFGFAVFGKRIPDCRNLEETKLQFWQSVENRCGEMLSFIVYLLKWLGGTFCPLSLLWQVQYSLACCHLLLAALHGADHSTICWS